jgi:hypothetical protein
MTRCPDKRYDKDSGNGVQQSRRQRALRPRMTITLSALNRCLTAAQQKAVKFLNLYLTYHLPFSYKSTAGHTKPCVHTPVLSAYFEYYTGFAYLVKIMQYISIYSQSVFLKTVKKASFQVNFAIFGAVKGLKASDLYFILDVKFLLPVKDLFHLCRLQLSNREH